MCIHKNIYIYVYIHTNIHIGTTAASTRRSAACAGPRSSRCARAGASTGSD